MTLPLFKVFMHENVVEELKGVFTSGYITQGNKVNLFEEELKKWFNYPYILTLNSATSGLTLAIRMCNLQEDDEILCTPLTCFATTCSVLANRVKIKWVDVDPDTCNIDLEDLKLKITRKTKAIIFVHWGGTPVDLHKLHDIRDKYQSFYNTNISIIEDCAHSFGAEYDNKMIGTHGNICVFSLQAIKHLTTGDGGLIFLPNQEMYDRAKLLRWYGIDRDHRNKGDFRLEQDISEWGYKFHMNDINATIGLVNLPNIYANLKYARNIAKLYEQHLSNLEGVYLLKRPPLSKSAYWIYTLRIVDRDLFIKYMKSKDIMVSQVHKRNDINTCVRSYVSYLPNLNELETDMISIPIGWWLSFDDIYNICLSIKNWSESIPRRIEKRDYSKNFFDLLHQLNQYNYEISQNDFENRLEKLQSNGLIMVSEINNKIIATGKLLIEDKFSNPVGHIEDVVVDVEFRKCNMGRRIIYYLIEEARKVRCYKVVLNCKDDLVPFYESCGFTKNGAEMRMYL